jgi:hypothetical protein
MQNDQRNQRMMMNSPMNAQYQSMMRNGMVNGAPNELKRTAAMNNRPYAASLMRPLTAPLTPTGTATPWRTCR